MRRAPRSDGKQGSRGATAAGASRIAMHLGANRPDSRGHRARHPTGGLLAERSRQESRTERAAARTWRWLWEVRLGWSSAFALVWVKVKRWE